jgi:hypothetical protein
MPFDSVINIPDNHQFNVSKIFVFYGSSQLVFKIGFVGMHLQQAQISSIEWFSDQSSY